MKIQCAAYSSAGILLLISMLGVAAAENAKPSDRPNVLWITCEDASPNLGCYGDEFAVTPSLDRLATEGVRYTNAFSVCGVCAVGRSSLITGMYPTSIGSHHMRCRTVLPDQIKCFSELLRGEGYYCTNNVKTDYNFDVSKNAWDESSRKAHWRKRADGQPFFAVFNFTVSHESQIRCSEKVYEERMSQCPPSWRHDPAKVTVPPYHPDTPEVRKDWARYYDMVSFMDLQAGAILQQLQEDGLAEETIVFFYSDHGAGMPRCKKWIYDGGSRVPLIVRFPEKYKSMSPASPGGTTDRLVSFVDFAPTVLSLVGTAIPRQMQGRAFLGTRAAPPRDNIYLARNRMAERYDIVRGVHNKRYLYIRNYMPHLTYSQHISYTYQMPTMQAWDKLHQQGQLTGPAALWFRPAKPLEELFDTLADPHQIHDLAHDPKYRSVLERMRNDHLQWIAETHDMGFLPEHDQALRSADSTPWELALDPKKYPQERILAAADLTGRGPDKLPQLIELLADDDAAVRYWACVGLEVLGPQAKSAEPLLIDALQDPSPNVQIAAANALVSIGSSTDVMPILKESLKHPSEWVRLRALNLLDKMDGRAEAALPEIEAGQKLKSRFGYDHRAMTQLAEKFK
jgi:N-sulfoglucosamine sulfohydrolase